MSWDESNSVPLIDLTLQHGETSEETRRRLDMTVNEVTGKFGSMVQRVEWAADRSRVKLSGVGFWVKMSVDNIQILVGSSAVRWSPA